LVLWEDAADSGCQTMRRTHSVKNEKKIRFFRPTIDPLDYDFPPVFDGRLGDEKCVSMNNEKSITP
jgi:hypothetical protein